MAAILPQPQCVKTVRQQLCVFLFSKSPFCGCRAQVESISPIKLRTPLLNPERSHMDHYTWKVCKNQHFKLISFLCLQFKVMRSRGSYGSSVGDRYHLCSLWVVLIICTVTSDELYAMASQISSISIIQQLFRLTTKKASKALHYWPFARGVHWWLAYSRHKGPIMQKAFPCQMSSWWLYIYYHWHYDLISMGSCKKDVTPLLTHWSYVFLAQTHRSLFGGTAAFPIMTYFLNHTKRPMVFSCDWPCYQEDHKMKVNPVSTMQPGELTCNTRQQNNVLWLLSERESMLIIESRVWTW